MATVLGRVGARVQNPVFRRGSAVTVSSGFWQNVNRPCLVGGGDRAIQDQRRFRHDFAEGGKTGYKRTSWYKMAVGSLFVGGIAATLYWKSTKSQLTAAVALPASQQATTQMNQMEVFRREHHIENIKQLEKLGKQAGHVIKGLPEYSHEDVANHTTKETGVWVTFGHGVYDMTEFVDNHPGGDKILLAAGGSLEPFWNLYAIHKTEEVYGILEEHRIGNYKDAHKLKAKDVNDPFVNDPERHPALRVNSAKPFNAETPPELLIDGFKTPNELFFVRNHLPVPTSLDAKTHKLEVEVPGKRNINLSVNYLKKNFKEHTIIATTQCAGNRRSQMSGFKPVKGLTWNTGAIGTAEWTGVKLRDVLLHAGVTDDDDSKYAHVQFEGSDKDPTTGGSYGASIPFSIAMNPVRDVLLAYKMNGEDIPVDHGYPLRVIIPGNIGARSVKWLSKIILSDKESQSFWMQNDYKSFGPSVEFGQLDYSKAPPVQEYPVQSAICSPKQGSSVDEDEETVTVKGYAWSGGGRGIVRVDVSVDGGETWFAADLQNAGQKVEHVWAWTLWEVDIPIPKDHKGKLDIFCKAIDSSHNVQPDTMKGIWNVRGLLNTAWHHVMVNVTKD